MDPSAEDDQNAPKSNSQQKTYSYEEAIEKQKAEGGPRRYYAEGEGLDHESARVSSEEDGGNSVAKTDSGYKRDFTHVNVQYCISWGYKGTYVQLKQIIER